MADPNTTNQAVRELKPFHDRLEQGPEAVACFTFGWTGSVLVHRVGNYNQLRHQVTEQG